VPKAGTAARRERRGDFGHEIDSPYFSPHKNVGS
jgi:hypothetical protein